MELEGLRGLAALMVVLGHFLLAFYPLALLGPAVKHPVQHIRFEDSLYGSPLAVLYAATFAVAVFFVLSGFVLTIGYFQTGRVEIIKKLAAKRYLRLMLPALASVLLCLVLIKLSASHAQEAATLTHSHWLRETWKFDAGVVDAFVNGTLGIFIDGKSAYNNVLWTMTTEFLGSFMVFSFILLFAQSKYRWVGYAALAVATFNTWFLPFVLGMVVADAYSLGYVRRIKKGYVTVLLVAAALFLGGYPARGAEDTAYSFLQLPLHINLQMFYLTVAALLMMYAVISSEKLARFMRLKWVSSLGKYTFSLYLVHLAVLYTFTTGVFVVFQGFMGYNAAFLLTFVVSLPVLYAVTKLFEKYVDAPSVVFSRQAAEVFEGKKEVGMRGRLVSARETLALRYALLQERASRRFRSVEDIFSE